MTQTRDEAVFEQSSADTQDYCAAQDEAINKSFGRRSKPVFFWGVFYFVFFSLLWLRQKKKDSSLSEFLHSCWTPEVKPGVDRLQRVKD